MVCIIHTNINNSRTGNDSLMQIVKELQAGIAVVSEPYDTRKSNLNWIYSSDKKPTVGIYWSKVKDMFGPMQLVRKGEGYACVRWNGFYIMGCYFSPNKRVNEFKRYLSEIGLVIGSLRNYPLIIMGNFNARHKNWDSNAKTRQGYGQKLFDWSINMELAVMNRKDVTTCRRPQGQSVIDITLVNKHAANKVKEWKVEEEYPVISDHCTITMQLEDGVARRINKVINSNFPRWNYKKVDLDALQGFAESMVWGRERSREVSPNSLAEWLDKGMRDLANASMPRSFGGGRRQAYWWNSKVTDLRKMMIKKRRKLTNYKSKNRNRNITNREIIENDMYIEYRKALKEYKDSIRKSKRDSWNRSLKELNKEPWGTAFKIATLKIRPAIHHAFIL
jgi:hypothetical protein